jgi:hypothetical protein
MAGRLALADGRLAIPERLAQTRIGPLTAPRSALRTERD